MGFALIRTHHVPTRAPDRSIVPNLMKSWSSVRLTLIHHEWPCQPAQHLRAMKGIPQGTELLRDPQPKPETRRTLEHVNPQASRGSTQVQFLFKVIQDKLQEPLQIVTPLPPLSRSLVVSSCGFDPLESQAFIMALFRAVVGCWVLERFRRGWRSPSVLASAVFSPITSA